MLVHPAAMILCGTAAAFAWYRLMPPREVRRAEAATALAAIPNSFYIPFPVALAVAAGLGATAGELDYVAAMVGVGVLAINPLQWTLGTVLVTAHAEGQRRQSWWRYLKYAWNGPVVGIVAGVILAQVPWVRAAANHEADSIQLLRMLVGAAESIGSAMAPMAMIILGSLIAQCELRNALDWRLLVPVFAIRFVAIPAFTWYLLVAGWIPAEGWLPFVLMLSAASPPATNLALAAKRYDGDWETVSNVLFVTNTSALVILPLWIAVGLSMMGSGAAPIVTP
jgi:predicted permease